MTTSSPRFLDFFAGSGLVSEGAKHAFEIVWANDICAKKAAVYTANHGNGHFQLGSIGDVRGEGLPIGDVVWASFPCQDLSLAGKMAGLDAARSGLFWEWLRVLDEMPYKPTIIALENVVGLLSARQGEDFRMLYSALRQRSYRVGPMVLDAREWVPQSRPRVFVVAVHESVETASHEDYGPNWAHPEAVRRAVSGLDDIIFWSMPQPPRRSETLSDLIDWNAEVFDQDRTDNLLSLVSARHRELLDKIPASSQLVFPAYRRTRNGRQVLELRFDDISGCLRTAEGGSSRQFLLLFRRGKWSARLITPREAALLMGAPESYKLSDSYNESYNAMGDAVAVPVVKYLVDKLFLPIYESSQSSDVRASLKRPSRVRLIA